MTDRIEQRLRDLGDAGRIGIMPFLTAGYPHPSHLADLIRACDDAGAAAIEIGFPFSDPIADGPVISASMQRALEAGITPPLILDIVNQVRGDLEAPLIAMVSESIVHRLGGPAYVDTLATAGFDGVIIPDIDLIDAAAYAEKADQTETAFAMLIAPTTSEERAARIASLCRGFIYLLARTGLTGERAEVPDLGQRVARLRACSSIPIAAGFGISSAQHVAAVAQWADAAIVGSALVRRLDGGADPADEARQFVRSLVAATAKSTE